MKDLISIIIPTYNAQDYVSDCINSILKQSYGNFEIILIDDGSTDNTKEIVGNIARNDKRIKLVFNETNMGCAYSRNLGLELHKGAYITYIDADDIVTYNYLEKLYKNIKKVDAEISICQYKKIFNQEKNINLNAKNNKKIKILDSNKAIYYLSRKEKFTIALWGKLFKSALFNDEWFPIVDSASDCVMMYKLLNKSKKIVFEDSVIYLYRKVMSSITHRKDQVNLDLIYETKKALLYVKCNVFSKYNDLKYRYIKNLLITYNKMLFNCKYDEKITNFIKKEILSFYDEKNFNIIENCQIRLFLSDSYMYKIFFPKRYEVIK